MVLINGGFSPPDLGIVGPTGLRFVFFIYVSSFLMASWLCRV